MSVNEDRSRLGWGIALLAIGTFWLLQSIGLMRGGIGELIAALILGGVAAVLFHAWRRGGGRRWVPLVFGALFAGLAVTSALEGIGLGHGFLPPLVIFGALALAFARIWSGDPARLSALLAAWISAVIGLSSALGAMGLVGGRLGGSLLLIGVAVPFAWYFLRTGREWAILPAGLNASMAFVPLLEDTSFGNRLGPPLVIGGMAATFAAYHAVRTDGRARWARWVAIFLAFVAVVTLLAGMAGWVMLFAVPIALIGGGIWLILRAREGGRPIPPSGPAGPDQTPGPPGPGGTAEPPALDGSGNTAQA